MTLLELFLEYGNPADTYSDEVLARFLTDVDDGTLFGEALAEIGSNPRLRIAHLVDDRTSRSLSHQMIGQMVTEQLKRYTKSYLEKKYDDHYAEIRTIRLRRECDAAQDDGDAKGCLP